MPEDDKKEEQEEQAPEPWRALMSDVSEMMGAAIIEAVKIMSNRFGSITSIEDAGAEVIIPMAVAIFEATAQAEAGRRMIEAQKESLALGVKLQGGGGGGGILRIGPDGQIL